MNYWLKPIAAKDFPFILNHKDKEIDNGIRFTKKSALNVREGDLLIIYVVSIRDSNRVRLLYSSARLLENPRRLKHSNREIDDRWPLYGKVQYLTSGFRDNWFEKNCYLSSIKSDYLATMPSEYALVTKAHNTLRARNGIARIGKKYFDFLNRVMCD